MNYNIHGNEMKDNFSADVHVQLEIYATRNSDDFIDVVFHDIDGWLQMDCHCENYGGVLRFVKILFIFVISFRNIMQFSVSCVAC